ncbi:uncharacterized protein LOC144076201 [Stigmatopora argus]
MALVWIVFVLVNVVLIEQGLCVSVGATKGQPVTMMDLDDEASHNHQKSYNMTEIAIELHNATKRQQSDEAFNDHLVGHNATKGQQSDKTFDDHIKGHNATKDQQSGNLTPSDDMSDYQHDKMDESEYPVFTVLV